MYLEQDNKKWRLQKNICHVSQVLKLYCVCGSSGVDYQLCVLWLIVGATTAAGKTDWALQLQTCILMTIMFIHITMELMHNQFSISPFRYLSIPEKFCLMAQYLVMLWPYMLRLTTIQCTGATQHSFVTKLAICTPVRKSLDPPLVLAPTKKTKIIKTCGSISTDCKDLSHFCKGL